MSSSLKIQAEFPFSILISQGQVLCLVMKKHHLGEQFFSYYEGDFLIQIVDLHIKMPMPMV